MENRTYTRYCSQCDKYFKTNIYNSVVCNQCKQINKEEMMYKNQLKRLNLEVPQILK